VYNITFAHEKTKFYSGLHGYKTHFAQSINLYKIGNFSALEIRKKDKCYVISFIALPFCNIL